MDKNKKERGHEHEWNLVSEYCIHCGISKIHELDSPYPCTRSEKVTAISHTRFIARNNNVIPTTPRNNNTNSK
jgi:hypothetical protein